MTDLDSFTRHSTPVRDTEWSTIGHQLEERSDPWHLQRYTGQDCTIEKSKSDQLWRPLAMNSAGSMLQALLPTSLFYMELFLSIQSWLTLRTNQHCSSIHGAPLLKLD